MNEPLHVYTVNEIGCSEELWVASSHREARRLYKKSHRLKTRVPVRVLHHPDKQKLELQKGDDSPIVKRCSTWARQHGAGFLAHTS